MRRVDPPPTPRPGTKHCEAPGCAQATREGKPFCSDHVDSHPYVIALMDTIAAREQQDEKVRDRGPKAVEASSITAQEILQHLALHGPRTQERLCREVNLDAKVLDGYILALLREGLVSLGQTKRGSTVVRLRKRRRR